MTPHRLAILFALLTAAFWGLYGPALQKSRTPGETPFKPFIFIGIAYLVWGVLGGLLAVKVSGGNFSFAPESKAWGSIAGTLGAFGALTLTMAVFQARIAGKGPELVMPIVFGGATAVAVITGLVMARSTHVPPMQILGFLLVIAGVVLIQKYAAHSPPTKPAAPAVVESAPTPRPDA